MTVKNEQIKASIVDLTGLQGEALGEVTRTQALTLARQHKADLVCLSLMSSPPPCRLVPRGGAAQLKQAQRRSDGNARTRKVKELRLTAHIEQHDYETKRRQAEKLLQGGEDVLLVVKLQGKQGPQAQALLEQLTADLAHAGTKKTGIQLSGKQAMVQLVSRR